MQPKLRFNMRTSLAFSPLDLFSIWNGDLDFHWLKFVNRNIIYLLNMPSNNVTLFLSTFCWFYFLGFFTYKQKHTEIKTHKFRIVLWFIALKKKLSARISVSKRQCIKNFSCFLYFYWNTSRDAISTKESIMNFYWLFPSMLFIIFMLYAHFWCKNQIKKTLQTKLKKKDSTPAAAEVFICLWIVCNLYGFRCWFFLSFLFNIIFPLRSAAPCTCYVWLVPFLHRFIAVYITICGNCWLTCIE